VDNLGSGLWEIRTRLDNRIARTLFFVHEGEIVLLHGLIKKTRKTPTQDRDLALKRKNAYVKSSKNRNPHRGSNFDEFLKEEGILDEVQAAALKRDLALKLADIMKKKRIKKSTIAKQMRTSRAAFDRLLDPANTSVTLVTLTRAARAVGGKIKIELVAA
jgi:hypothetical protein